MGEHEVTMAQAEIRALTEAKRAMSIRIANLEEDKAILEAENASLRALLARSKTSLAERFNDPMQDGGAA